MKRFRLWPQSLVGQITMLVALAMFLAQAINFGLLLQERNRMQLVSQTAPAVYRVVDALDAQGPRVKNGDRRRARFALEAPQSNGTPRDDIEQRALKMFRDAGVPVIRVVAYEELATLPARTWDRMRGHANHSGEQKGQSRRLTLGAEYEAGKWVITQTRLEGRAPKFGGWLVGQTLILYAIVLLPLLWIGRRLARPLKQLTSSAEQFAKTGAADRVDENGPGDVRQLTTAFNAMRSRIIAMLDEKDRMLGAIGHDLRTPLASLRLRAESVENDVERIRMSETIDEMNRMLEDILSLARAGRSSEEMQKVDLSSLADALVEDFVELGSPVEMIDSDRAVAKVRPQQIRRAVRNLIENAIVYGDRAEIEVRKDDTKISIRVMDFGPGIAPDRMDEMMEPFTRMEGSRNRETGGAGLGLALVRTIMAEHGGELRLVNRPQGGLIASLEIPI